MKRGARLLIEEVYVNGGGGQESISVWIGFAIACIN